MGRNHYAFLLGTIVVALHNGILWLHRDTLYACLAKHTLHNLLAAYKSLGARFPHTLLLAEKKFANRNPDNDYDIYPAQYQQHQIQTIHNERALFSLLIAVAEINHQIIHQCGQRGQCADNVGIGRRAQCAFGIAVSVGSGDIVCVKPHQGPL